MLLVHGGAHGLAKQSFIRGHWLYQRRSQVNVDRNNCQVPGYFNLRQM